MCRLGDDTDQSLSADERSYVVTGPGSGFHVSQVPLLSSVLVTKSKLSTLQENVSPHPSPNPRATGKLVASTLNEGSM